MTANTLPPLSDPSFPGRLQRALDDLGKQKQTRNTPVQLPSYLVATVPPAADWAFCLIQVTNETGGSVPAFSDSSVWRRVTDRAIIS